MRSWASSSVVLLLLACGVGSSGCAAYEEENQPGAESEDDLVSIQANGKPLATAKTNFAFEKSFSITKDYNVGTPRWFSATAIVRATVKADLDGILNLKPTVSGASFERISAKMDGTWNIAGDVNVSLRFSGAAIADKTLVKSASADLRKLVAESRVLASSAIGKVKFPFGEVGANAELVMNCNAGAGFEFDASATTRVGGPVSYEIVWDRSHPKVNVTSVDVGGRKHTAESQWKFVRGDMKPTYEPPKITINNGGSGTLNFECSITPRFTVKMDVTAGVSQVAEGQLAAYVEGGLKVGANATVNIQNRSWSGTAGINATLNGGYSFVGSAAFGLIDINSAEKYPLIGTTVDGIIIKNVSHQGSF